VAWQPPGHEATGYQPDGWQPDAEGTDPPVLVGSIPNISETENTGTHQYDLSAYFLGADTYAIAPAVETGWSFDTGTGILEIDTDALGTFGPFIVTATNGNGDTPSNEFSVEVEAAVTETEQPTGGWLFLNQYNAEQQRRRARERRRKELEEETEQIENELDRNIAQLMREQEAIDDKRKDLERLAELAKANADIEAAKQYSASVAAAFEKALIEGSARSMVALERELKRAAEDEEFLLTALLMMLD
jgi:hypothetical protein